MRASHGWPLGLGVQPETSLGALLASGAISGCGLLGRTWLAAPAVSVLRGRASTRWVLSPLHAHVRQISMHSHTAPDHDRNPTPRGSTHTTAPDRVINPWRPGNPRRQVVPVAVVGEFDDVMARREVEVELSSGRDSLTSDQIGRKDKPAACCAFLHRVDAAAQSDHRTAGVQRPYSQGATGEYAPNDRPITRT